MEIKFKLEDDTHISLVDSSTGTKVGQIFTPGGTCNDNGGHSIQVCGFSNIKDLWGCGVFGSKKKQALDISLLWDKDTHPQTTKSDIVTDCCRCYNKPCSCDDITNELDMQSTNIKKRRILSALDD